MKHLRLFENRSFSYVRDIINNYNDLIEKFKPFIFQEYMVLAKDGNYEPREGYKPELCHGIDFLNKYIKIESAVVYKGGVTFCLHQYYHDELMCEYFIDLNESKIEEIFINISSKKYNL